jgi:hypothetical protein
MSKNTKEQYFVTLASDRFPDLITNISITLHWESNFFSNTVAVYIQEQSLDRAQLYVEPHFEQLANKLLNKKLKNIRPKNIRWFHLNPFQNKLNPDIVPEYREVVAQYKNKKVNDIKWKAIA